LIYPVSARTLVIAFGSPALEQFHITYLLAVAGGALTGPRHSCDELQLEDSEILDAADPIEYFRGVIANPLNGFGEANPEDTEIQDAHHAVLVVIGIALVPA
jgi:hypothetical protein